MRTTRLSKSRFLALGVELYESMRHTDRVNAAKMLKVLGGTDKPRGRVTTMESLSPQARRETEADWKAQARAIKYGVL